MPRKKKLTRTVTRAPDSQVTRGPDEIKLDESEWVEIASDAWQSIIAIIGTRSALETNLQTAYQLYERDNGDGGTQNDPYVDSSDLTVPLVFAKVRGQKTEVASLTFVPDFYLFTGLDEQSSAIAPDMQTRWNYDFFRLRGPFYSWKKAHDKMLHMALRDGTAFMECSWVKDVRTTRYKVNTPDLDENGMIQQHPETGDVLTKPEYTTMPVTIYDGVVLNPVMLKDVLLIPNDAQSVEQAAGVAIYHLYYESDLRAMIEDGILNQDWVDKALNYNPQGFSDTASRFQGVYNWTAGGQLSIGIGQGQGISTERFVNRGPLGVWVLYTRQYDLDKDKIEEPNILFIHEVSGYMIGVTADKDLSPIRLIVSFAPLPRPDSPLGFGVAEIIGPFQAEATLLWNQRNDAVSTRLEVPLLMDTNTEVKDSGMSWGNGKIMYIKGNAQQGSLQNVLWFPQLPEVPLASYQQEQGVQQMADSALGGAQSRAGNRATAAEIKDTRGSSDLGVNDIAGELRTVSHQIFDAIWSLTLQYGFNPDGTERNPTPGMLPMTADMMKLPFKRQVSGEDDPVDKQAQVEELLAAWEKFSQSPFIAGNLMHRYNFERLLAGKMGIVALDGIWGTPQEVQQMIQDQAQQQKEAADLEKETAKATIAEKYNRGRPQAGQQLIGPDDVPTGDDQQQQQQQQGGGNGQAPQGLAGVMAAGAG